MSNRARPRNREWLILSMMIAIGLRIAASIWLGDTLGGERQMRAMDQYSYDSLARSILAGQGFSFESEWYPFREPAFTPTAHWSFLYPVFLSGVYLIFGAHPLAARLVQALICGALNTWLVYRLGKRLFGERTGLVAAVLYAIYPYFTYYEATLMTEPFFIAGVVASLELGIDLAGFSPTNSGNRFILQKVVDKNDAEHPGQLWWKWILLGAVLGAAALLRQTMLLWVPFLFGWIFVSRFKQSKFRTLPTMSVCAGVILLFILPLTVRNYLVFHACLPLNSNAGYALYSANHPNHGTEFDQDYAAPLPAELTGKGLNEAQWNTELTRRGVRFILDDPTRYAKLSLDRIGVLFNFWFSRDSSLSSNLLRVFSFGLYLPFFVLGLGLSWHERRRCSLIYLFGVVFALIHIMTWASIRYRLPIDAALMPFAALSLLWVYQIAFKKKILLMKTEP